MTRLNPVKRSRCRADGNDSAEGTPKGPGMTLIRLWDKDFNLLHSYQGDISDMLNGLTVTVDHQDKRESGRFVEAKIRWA
jgi:hypothetical protein